MASLRPDSAIKLVLSLLCAVGLLTGATVAAAQTPTVTVMAQSQDAYVAYDATHQTFEIGSAGVSRTMGYDPANGYHLVSFKNKLTGSEWFAPNSASSRPSGLGLDGQVIGGSTRDFVISGYSARRLQDDSLQLQITLARSTLVLDLYYAVFPGTNIVEQWSTARNDGTAAISDLTAFDSSSLAVHPTNDAMTLYWVQGLNPGDPDPNKPHQEPVLELRSIKLGDGSKQSIGSSERSSESCMSWYALVSPARNEGLIGGIEWSGAWQVDVTSENGMTSLDTTFPGTRRVLAPGQVVESPRRFAGFFRGGLDEASNATHVFSRRYLMRPQKADSPWTQYNTWFAYYTNLNEEQLKREVDAAAALGIELFYVDAGWYEGSPDHGDFSWGLGSWRENRDKFPSGLASFADYVHGKGMRFGLWVEPERVDLRYAGPGKEVSRDWLAPGTAFDQPPPAGVPQTSEVCLGHAEARAWMKDWLSRLVEEYHVDWLKWDDNAWMSCDPPGQVGQGNYDHVMGLYEVLDYIRAEYPDLIVENCASGGNRMDFALLRRTDVAWLSDQTDPSYRVRYHMFGASYPFPPEYLNSWLVESYWEHLGDVANNPDLLRSWLQSRMMGAFGISVSTLGWNPTVRATVADEIRRYKSIRPLIAGGKHYHLLPQTDLVEPLLPLPEAPDAAEFYDPATDRAVVFLFRGNIPWSSRSVRLRGLTATATYQVTSEDGAVSVRRTGAQLMNPSITQVIAENKPSTVLTVTPVQAP